MRLVLVEWLDAIGPANPEWTALSKINRKAVVVKAVGWMIAESKTAITLIAMKHEARGDEEVHGSNDLTIPVGCIKSVVDLVASPSAGGRSTPRSRRAGVSKGTGR